MSGNLFAGLPDSATSAERFDTLSKLIDAFDYDQVCVLLSSLHTETTDGIRHEQ